MGTVGRGGDVNLQTEGDGSTSHRPPLLTHNSTTRLHHQTLALCASRTHLGDRVTDANRLQVRGDVVEKGAVLSTREGEGRVTVVGPHFTKESPRRVQVM